MTPNSPRKPAAHNAKKKPADSATNSKPAPKQAARGAKKTPAKPMAAGAKRAAPKAKPPATGRKSAATPKASSSNVKGVGRVAARAAAGGRGRRSASAADLSTVAHDSIAACKGDELFTPSDSLSSLHVQPSCVRLEVRNRSKKTVTVTGSSNERTIQAQI
jgi:hypothetical protein